MVHSSHEKWLASVIIAIMKRPNRFQLHSTCSQITTASISVFHRPDGLPACCPVTVRKHWRHLLLISSKHLICCLQIKIKM